MYSPITYLCSLSLHDALPIFLNVQDRVARLALREDDFPLRIRCNAPCRTGGPEKRLGVEGRSFLVGLDSACFRSWHRKSGKDRKSTRLNSSHLVSSYAVFCLK